MENFKFDIGDTVRVIRRGNGFSESDIGKTYVITHRKMDGYGTDGENGDIGYKCEGHDNEWYADYVGETSFKLVSKSIPTYEVY